MDLVLSSLIGHFVLFRCVSRVNAINVGWTLTDNEDAIQRVEMDNINWIEEADKVKRVRSRRHFLAHDERVYGPSCIC